MASPTFAIAVQFTIKPEHIDAFRTRVVQQAKDSLAKEVGCLQFDVLVDETDPAKIFLYETYINADALVTHRETAHFADFFATISPWIESRQVIRLNTILSSAQKST